MEGTTAAGRQAKALELPNEISSTTSMQFSNGKQEWRRLKGGEDLAFNARLALSEGKSCLLLFVPSFHGWKEAVKRMLHHHENEDLHQQQAPIASYSNSQFSLK